MISGQFQYKRRTDNNWTSAGSSSITTVSGNFAYTYRIEDLSDTTAYDVRVILTDGLNQTFEFITTVGTANYPLMWGRHGSSFGRNFDNDLPYNVQVGNGGILTEGPITIGETTLTESQLIALKQLL